MNWKGIQLTIAIMAMLGWFLYVWLTPTFSKNGYHVPSPDNAMSAMIMKVHETPPFGSDRTYYEISMYDKYDPTDIHLKPYASEQFPLSIADDNFTLTRDNIEWNMHKGTIAFHFGRTNIVRQLRH